MIDTNAIRNRMMHLAVSGKLVGQNMEDGSASELVEKLSKEINNSPRREVTTDEIPYEIPGNWSWCRLSDIGTTNIGLTYHPEDVVIDGIPVLRSNNIKNNKMDFDDLIKVNCEIREKQYINENDILICARNGSKALVGKCAIYNGELGMTSFGAFMAVYRTWCFEYVYYYFQTKVFRRYFENENNKQINQVTQAILKDAIIPLPPMNEQKRIVKKIKETFEFLDIIDNLQTQYSSDLEVLKSKIIDAGIQGKLTEQLPEDGTAEELLAQIDKEKKALKDAGIYKNKKKITIKKSISKDEIFEIPKSWKWVRLGQLADVYGRIGFRGYTKADLVEAGQGAISMSPSNITFSGDIIFENNTYITWEKYDESPEIKIREGDVLIVKTGSSFGKTGIVEKMPEKCTINPQLAILKNILCDRYYLNLYMKCSHAWKQYNSFVVGAATPTFSQEKLANMLIPLPPLNEQKRIVDRVKRIFDVV